MYSLCIAIYVFLLILLTRVYPRHTHFPLTHTPSNHSSPYPPLHYHLKVTTTTTTSSVTHSPSHPTSSSIPPTHNHLHHHHITSTTSPPLTTTLSPSPHNPPTPHSLSTTSQPLTTTLSPFPQAPLTPHNLYHPLFNSTSLTLIRSSHPSRIPSHSKASRSVFFLVSSGGDRGQGIGALR